VTGFGCWENSLNLRDEYKVKKDWFDAVLVLYTHRMSLDFENELM